MSDERYLVTGARGMLGQAVTAELLARGCVVAPTDLPETDLADEAAARRLFGAVRPTRVIHCAAYTAVDRAETDPETCRRVNAEAPGIVARACARAGAAMLFVSTDFVFDGEPPAPPGRPSEGATPHPAGASVPPNLGSEAARRPYREDDEPHPLSIYGQTKLAGEQAVAAALERHQIVRTAWLYGPGKRNFVSAMLERLWRGERVRVVDDQTGSPTYTPDLARALADLVALCGRGAADVSGARGSDTAVVAGVCGRDIVGVAGIRGRGVNDAAEAATGVFHCVNAGQTTWCGLTRRAAELAGLDPNAVEAIPTSGYPTPARRPAWSVLDCPRVRSLGMTPMRPWEEALAEYVTLLAREHRG